MNMENHKQQSGASVDECIELAEALERARALKIINDVMSLPIGGAEVIMPTPYQSGYQMACHLLYIA